MRKQAGTLGEIQLCKLKAQVRGMENFHMNPAARLQSQDKVKNTNF
jgi:hypothetical protein